MSCDSWDHIPLFIKDSFDERINVPDNETSEEIETTVFHNHSRRVS